MRCVPPPPIATRSGLCFPAADAQIVFEHTRAPRLARSGTLQRPLPPPVAGVLEALGVAALYTHQAIEEIDFLCLSFVWMYFREYLVGQVFKFILRRYFYFYLISTCTYFLG
jgi:hypothetical protein